MKKFTLILFLLSFLFQLNAQMRLDYRNQTGVDGDTFDVSIKEVSKRKGQYYNWQPWPIRLFSVDAWETSKRGQRRQTDEQNQLAWAAKDSLRTWIRKEEFLIQYLGKDSGGKRLVCIIHFADGTTAKDRLKKYGLASGKYEDYYFRNGRIGRRKKKPR